MRSSAERAQRYGAKLSGDVAASRANAYGKKQSSNFREAAKGQVEIERMVKLILTAGGVSPRLNHFYMDFGKELARVVSNYKGDTSLKEIQILEDKWFSRGLNVVILDLIKSNLIVWSPQPFILDDSLLDGGDVLS